MALSVEIMVSTSNPENNNNKKHLNMMASFL